MTFAVIPVVLARIGTLALLIGASFASLARPSAAQPAEEAETVRESRRVLLGLSPAWPWFAHHDYTTPLPRLRQPVPAGARVGNYSSYNDEGPDPDYRYVTLGAGMEYAGDGGFTAWADLGPALIDGERGWYGSFGLGYRFGAPPQ